MSGREWLIRKGGYFYRANRAGYTTEKVSAGRYTKAEADAEAAIEPENFTVLHESEIPDAPEIEALKAEAMGRTAAVRDVLAERRRQVEGEGWTPEHDDAHANGELANAAACYALGATVSKLKWGHKSPPAIWPWRKSWWKIEGGARRMLVKAGALIIAEIERLDRRDAK
ncbi:ead/Ea22-like family protein [Mesorhizobium sp. M6A.T.Cr.TU.017.01.1.1]|uniref:ead/Ea22-like family protein n=1 Tax=Mesorhizobium sp. M6A.T.Cr.TU.017.01.1.1 TaxID=2496774 RepID=UPI000FD2E912|nr:ead/Ea22-like family protein [Mesorhizobium sp. M6A.T.Cr.TU.017.01.1.1]RUU99430.1 ead/Ea22-like family protein [Mesorhizobium sp. M6A.T.Cr.TU.017.01.1.1]